jgi:hypothetical protein
LTQNKAKLCKILIITLVFDKNANFFSENSQKSQKTAIIASTPDLSFQRFTTMDLHRTESLLFEILIGGTQRLWFVYLHF